VAAPVGARTLVAPYLLGPGRAADDLPAALGLADGPAALVRYGAEVDAVLVRADDEVRLVAAADLDIEPIASRAAYPLARVRARPGRGEVVARSDAAARLTRAWRTSLAAELGAAMSAAVEIARAHVAVRTQFDRPIGSLQAVQHRLAEAYVSAQGATWLARRAAWQLDDELAPALAAAYATSVAPTVFDAVHQVVGAIGFTTEFALHHATLRLPVLIAELGGPDAHAVAVSRIKWPRTERRSS